MTTTDVQRRTNPFTPEQHATANARAKICETCEHNGGITRSVRGWTIHTVKCGLCGCTGLSLVHGRCHADKWPAERTTPLPPVSAAAAATQQKLLLTCALSPGDVVTLTAAVRDLHRAYPSRFLTAVDTTARELWDNNPLVASFDPKDRSVRRIAMHYPLINTSNQRPGHFLHGYTKYLSSQLQLEIPLTELRGDIYLSQDEMTLPNQVERDFGCRGPFWIMMAGGKYDFTTKWWPPAFYQKVVDHFSGRIQFVQCGEKHHWHPPLTGVINLVGNTSVRQFISLMYHAQGVVCPVTFAMHLAAAVPTKRPRLRPCVVVAGGREPVHWEAYPGHQFLHTIGSLPCCANGGCWKSTCQRSAERGHRASACELPVPVAPDLVVPKCMVMIKPEAVIQAIEKYCGTD